MCSLAILLSAGSLFTLCVSGLLLVLMEGLCVCVCVCSVDGVGEQFTGFFSHHPSPQETLPLHVQLCVVYVELEGCGRNESSPV